jgi:hypothetical protein
MRRKREQPTRSLWVVRQPTRTLDRLRNVRDEAIAPEAKLVPEDPYRSRPAATDRALGDDAAFRAVGGSNRRRLDYEPPFRHADLKRRVVEVAVVEVADRSPSESRCHGLIEASIQSNKVPTGPERQPIEIDGDA